MSEDAVRNALRLCMGFRADEVRVGDIAQVQSGPVEVVKIERQNGHILLTCRWHVPADTPGAEHTDEGWVYEHTFRPLAHEHVTLWEKR